MMGNKIIRAEVKKTRKGTVIEVTRSADITVEELEGWKKQIDDLIDYVAKGIKEESAAK